MKLHRQPHAPAGAPFADASGAERAGDRRLNRRPRRAPESRRDELASHANPLQCASTSTARWTRRPASRAASARSTPSTSTANASSSSGSASSFRRGAAARSRRAICLERDPQRRPPRLAATRPRTAARRRRETPTPTAIDEHGGARGTPRPRSGDGRDDERRMRVEGKLRKEQAENRAGDQTSGRNAATMRTARDATSGAGSAAGTAHEACSKVLPVFVGWR